MTFRFYKGGPIAVVTKCEFWISEDGLCGCQLAEFVGARIPTSAYMGASKWHQLKPSYTSRAFSSTALLPLED
jgi:hypothetical protein